LVIVETRFFTKQIRALLDAESYRLMQLELVADAERGAIIKESGGLRKLRWSLSGRGKSGGIRVIYFWAKHQDIVLLLLAYPKNVQDTLTPAQRRILRAVVEEEFK
jgi:mRNA-degrading endonuclease RelE of RelBE toxin-antitoxin system